MWAADEENWAGWQLHVPGINYTLGNKDVYEYKLPYTIPTTPCCSRFSPWLYCCDVYCCCCLTGAISSLKFIDVVNQEDGNQLRFRKVKYCCLVPRVLVFHNGQKVGYASRTMRCGNRCLTCLEDVQSKPVLQVGLHNQADEVVARIDRAGLGCCCKLKFELPMKCVGCMFTCVSCTCRVQPSAAPFCWGCLDCDPVCCSECVQGPKTLCSLNSCAVCRCGCPNAPPQCWCPMCGIAKRRLPAVGTMKHDTFSLKKPDGQEDCGQLQAMYRGNYPSAYMHQSTAPLKITGWSSSGVLGKLLAGVASGMGYSMGGALPVFSGLIPQPEGAGPPYDGIVEVKKKNLVEAFLGLDGSDGQIREDMIVDQDVVFKDGPIGRNVKGWKLVEVGWSKSKGTMCGVQGPGRQQRLVYVTDKKRAQEIVIMATESMIGNYGTTFLLHFECMDPESQIVKKTDRDFDPLGGGFASQLEEVALAVKCSRIWQFPANCNKYEVQACRCPLYAQVVAGDGNVIPDAWGETTKPISVLMLHPPKSKYVVTEKS